MTKLCILSETLSENTLVKQSFNNDCLVKEYTGDSSVFDGVDYSNITHLALFYHFPGFYTVPFLDENYEETEDSSFNIIPPEKESYGYKYFGDKLIEKII